jgi:hypothetical protein
VAPVQTQKPAAQMSKTVEIEAPKEKFAPHDLDQPFSLQLTPLDIPNRGKGISATEAEVNPFRLEMTPPASQHVNQSVKKESALAVAKVETSVAPPVSSSRLPSDSDKIYTDIYAKVF